jgi:hypothetical protein
MTAAEIFNSVTKGGGNDFAEVIRCRAGSVPKVNSGRECDQQECP